jgi:hypothetical protein
MERALAMLDEAAGLVGPDAHGWTQIMWNRAGALRDLKRLEESASVWRQVADHAERYFGDPSDRLLRVLRHLAAVLDDLASPDAAAVARRADEMEDTLQAGGQAASEVSAPQQKPEPEQTRAEASAEPSNIKPDNGGFKHYIQNDISPQAISRRQPATALCGWTWIPQKSQRMGDDLDSLPICPTCERIHNELPKK